MLEHTVRGISRQHFHGHGVYLIRHNQIGRVLYVGQSGFPTLRIYQHTLPSATLKFDKFLVKHKPESLDWLAEIYQVEECDWLVKIYKPDDYGMYRQCLRHHTVIHNSALIAEAAMIAHCKPAHNYQTGRYANGKRTA
jgi:hypothetical protein